MAHPWKNRQRTGVVAFGAVAVLVLLVSAVVSVAIVTTTATGTAREPSGASSRDGERIRLAEAAEPVPSSTPDISQEPATSPSPSFSPESSAAASPRPSPTWTGKPGGEVYYGTFSQDECVKRGEEGVAAQKWSAYSCKSLVKRDEATRDGERVDEPGEVGELRPGQASRDHGLWVVDWLCMIRMEESCT